MANFRRLIPLLVLALVAVMGTRAHCVSGGIRPIDAQESYPIANAMGSGSQESKREKPPRKANYGRLAGAITENLTFEQGGALDAEGKTVVTVGDRLTKWEGVAVADRDHLCRLQYASKPGQKVELTFMRTEGGIEVEKKATIVLSDPAKLFPELYAGKDKRKRGYDWRKHSVACMRRDGLRTFLDAQLEEHKLQDAWEDLMAANARELDLWDCFEMSSFAQLVIGDPSSSHAACKELTDELAETVGRDVDWGNLDRVLLKLLDSPEFVLAPTEENVFLDFGTDWWAYNTFKDLDNKDLRARGGKFDLAWRGEPGFGALCELVNASRSEGKSVQFERIARCIRIWQRSLIKRCGSAVDDSVLLQITNSLGTCAVGGKGKNVWDGSKTKYAVILDLGGDDEYINCGGTGDGTDGGVVQPSCSIVIDLGGDDRYRSTGRFGVGAGVCGAGIVIDESGDDVYEAGEWGLGAAFNGVGLILDKAGNDRYIGGEYTIGVAAYGIGGVIDLAGNDTYNSHTFSIGVGLPCGVGFVLDRAGDDRYRCTGKEPSGYGTPGEWTGWGIGCGFGWRTLAAGGIGVVVDCAGKDQYDAGEFGLACGYFCGVGVVRDTAGDDIYKSSRYGLGTGAHCAAGLFMDDFGNDTYVGVCAASIAGVWDIATGYFFDGDGDDDYRIDGLGLGAGAQNAVGIFRDNGGNDRYRAKSSALGHGLGTTYGGGRLAKNFGIFWDRWGDDVYPFATRSNRKTLCDPEHGLFVDE
ncbi:MAG: hypothetical protein IT462_07895 [Planctomycetes bacterium]|nr:hypothetical protein [Planctomycetota bacterium]